MSKPQFIIGRFATAVLKSDGCAAQGWVVSRKPLTIQFNDGTQAVCKGRPVIIVTNPPPRPASVPTPKYVWDPNWGVINPENVRVLQLVTPFKKERDRMGRLLVEALNAELK